MIKISDSARDRLLQIMKNEEGEKKYVRVGVESGGCSGLSYKLDFDLQKLDDDELINDNKIQLLVNKKSFLYLVGTTLEFSWIPSFKIIISILFFYILQKTYLDQVFDAWNFLESSTEDCKFCKNKFVASICWLDVCNCNSYKEFKAFIFFTPSCI